MRIKKGQVWIETVIYTLIGLTLMGVVLALIMPKINQSRDRALVEQTIESLNILNERIEDVIDRGPGNIRVISSFRIKKGTLQINPGDDTITFILDGLSTTYSEPGAKIQIGKISLTTEENQKTSTTTLALNYNDLANISYFGETNIKDFGPSSAGYRFSIHNLGDTDNDGKLEIDIRENSRA